MLSDSHRQKAFDEVHMGFEVVPSRFRLPDGPSPDGSVPASCEKVGSGPKTNARQGSSGTCVGICDLCEPECDALDGTRALGDVDSAMVRGIWSDCEDLRRELNGFSRRVAGFPGLAVNFIQGRAAGSKSVRYCLGEKEIVHTLSGRNGRAVRRLTC